IRPYAGPCGVARSIWHRVLGLLQLAKDFGI
ncbi:uncharacterized protein METZ01_LOCUS498932, partial [marine metagenome]